jgi:hypothetical protein
MHDRNLPSRYSRHFVSHRDYEAGGVRACAHFVHSLPGGGARMSDFWTIRPTWPPAQYLSSADAVVITTLSRRGPW